MAAGDKWLLWLTGLHHLQVSGTPAAGGLVLAAAARAREAERESRGGPGDFGMRRGAGPGGNDMPIEPAGRPAASARTLGAFRGLPATDVELRMIAIQQVSVAFLDAYVRRTAPARQWLAQEAGPWVAGLGELSQR